MDGPSRIVKFALVEHYRLEAKRAEESPLFGHCDTPVWHESAIYYLLSS
jgi:hypothetical protein